MRVTFLAFTAAAATVVSARKYTPPPFPPECNGGWCPKGMDWCYVFANPKDDESPWRSNGRCVFEDWECIWRVDEYIQLGGGITGAACYKRNQTKKPVYKSHPS